MPGDLQRFRAGCSLGLSVLTDSCRPSPSFFQPMRHLSSSREVRLCRVAACSLILVVSVNGMAFILTAFLPVMIMSEDIRWWMIAGSFLLMALTAACSVRLANRFRCPVCCAGPLAFHLADYRHPRGFMVQRKLGMSMQILQTSRFLCPYCGEWIAVTVLS